MINPMYKIPARQSKASVEPAQLSQPLVYERTVSNIHGLPRPIFKHREDWGGLNVSPIKDD